MKCNCKDVYVEVVCFERDIAMFEQLGFSREVRFRRDRLAMMVNPNAAYNVVPTLVLLGEREFVFYGYASSWVSTIPGLIAADGERCVVVATNEDIRQPIAIVREDGSLPEHNAAMEYWTILAAAKQRMQG